VLIVPSNRPCTSESSPAVFRERFSDILIDEGLQ